MLAASSDISPETALLLTAALSTLLARLATSAVKLAISLVTAHRRLPTVNFLVKRLISVVFLQSSLQFNRFRRSSQGSPLFDRPR